MWESKDKRNNRSAWKIPASGKELFGLEQNKTELRFYSRSNSHFRSVPNYFDGHVKPDRNVQLVIQNKTNLCNM